jgi:putative acetyltransferase
VEENGKIIGHILYSHSKVLYSDTKTLPTITFGPVCVDPKHQKRGIGSMLIKESLTRAKAMGFKAVVICGNPDVYTRFGFKNTKYFNITHQDCSFPIGLMAL